MVRAEGCKRCRVRAPITMADDDKFSDAAIKELAEVSKLPSDADLVLFGRFVRDAGALYLEETGGASSAKIRADVEAIRRSVKPIDARKKVRRPHLIIMALEKASPETLHMLRRRAELRGQAFPSADEIMNPALSDDSARILDALTRAGGSVKQGRVRPGGKQSKKYHVELYAPVSPRNFAKREAERAAIRRLRAAWRWALARGDPDTERAIPTNIPATSASKENPGPFVRLAREFFAAMGINADVVHLINSIDFGQR
jgi:hypothetical protein